MTSLTKSTATGRGQSDVNTNRVSNRHALPDEVKEIVKPQAKITLERRDSFTLLKRQIDQGNKKKVEVKKGKSKTHAVNSPTQEKSPMLE